MFKTIKSWLKTHGKCKCCKTKSHKIYVRSHLGNFITCTECLHEWGDKPDSKPKPINDKVVGLKLDSSIRKAFNDDKYVKAIRAGKFMSLIEDENGGLCYNIYRIYLDTNHFEVWKFWSGRTTFPVNCISGDLDPMELYNAPDINKYSKNGYRELREHLLLNNLILEYSGKPTHV